MTRFAGTEKHDLRLRVNGTERRGRAEPRMLLSDFLRHELRLYGTHVGCEHGVCGACTVIVDGEPQRSCTQYALQAESAVIETVEGLADGETLNVLQQAFHRHHALQCGFCTAGILMSATHFLRNNPAPTRDEVRQMLSGHICRCTGYHGIVEAILDAAAGLTSDTKSQG
jgi:2-furoyl-CoA dehydrogenase 2Fe-2S iron sulfur subunit